MQGARKTGNKRKKIPMPTTVSNAPSTTTAIAPAAKSGPSQGLILSGGGAQAAYEVGIIKALLTGQSPATKFKPLDPDVVAGTSAGSINASLILSADSQDPAEVAGYVEDTWLTDLAGGNGKCNSGAFRIRANPLNFLNLGCYSPNLFSPFTQLFRDSAVITESLFKTAVNFLSSSGDLEQRASELLNLSVLVSTEPLRSFLVKRIRPDKIRSSRRALRIAVTNWRKGTLRAFQNEDMTDENGVAIILASSAIPGFYPPVEIDGDPYVDGGVLANTPLKPAIDAGANEVHIIYLHADIANVPLPKTPNMIHDIFRAITAVMCGSINNDIENAREVNAAVAAGDAGKNGAHKPLTVHRYHPKGDLGVGVLSFGLEGLQRLIDQGTRDAIEHDCDESQCVLPA